MDDILKYANENTVSAVRQMQHGSFFGSMDAPHPRILFVGNSITLHGVAEEIGWPRLCGMAASDEAHDYVHVLMQKLWRLNPSLGYAIAQAASWEREYWQPEDAYREIEFAPRWNADIIILRLSENTPLEAMETHDYTQGIVGFMDWLSPDRHAKFVVTDGFWPNPEKDLAMYRAAQARNAGFVSLSDLGQRDEMKAIGLFEHAGVAAHPGDQGMLAIAERLYSVVKHMV